LVRILEASSKSLASHGAPVSLVEPEQKLILNHRRVKQQRRANEVALA
jgi:hypothetical protein